MKIIQITHQQATELAPDTIFGLSDNGKVYYWGSEIRVVPITSKYATELQRSTGERIKVFGWIELKDEINN